MKNPPNPKERGLLKGAIRRVFSRSELRHSILNDARIEHKDSNRPRVTKWGRCAECKEPTALYQMEIDHVVPVVPVDKALEDLYWDDVINRIWCSPVELQALCKPCHKLKSKAEAKVRKEFRKQRSKK